MTIDGEAHPYVPQDLKLPGFVPIFLSQSHIVGVYGLSSCLVVLFMWILSGFVPKISKTDRTTPVYLAEVWKEYSKGDSRYVGRDAGVVSVEGITAVLEGPACLLAVYAIAAKKSYRHVLQIAICLGQLYGTASLTS
ncbi:hypothetical protein HAX54_025086 [Datura stramonium]|uniref:EXPERA domain-containing protein n=1 Tax=Datura stramonium TaxID=4076 RepID=A0ABS8V0Z1_DATST|nr:hypothetical protein [Datura stramonium]